jgi:DNA-binding CsgD family transcriptional regulator
MAPSPPRRVNAVRGGTTNGVAACRCGYAPAGFSGRSLLSPDSWEQLAASLGLSSRELQVAQGAFDDLREPEMARQLGISAHTVHTHLERVYRKLGVNSRGQLLVTLFGEYLALIDRAPLFRPRLIGGQGERGS